MLNINLDNLRISELDQELSDVLKNYRAQQIDINRAMEDIKRIFIKHQKQINASKDQS